jgi:carbamoyl-phosphate synthase small subunit
MKATFAAWGLTALLTGSVLAGTETIIKQRAKELRDQNNVRQGVAAPTQPAAATPTATAPAVSAAVTRLHADLAALKAGTPATPQQKQKLIQDLIAVAESAKPSQAAATKLADDVIAAFVEKPLSSASRSRFVQELDAILNPTKYPQAKPDGIFLSNGPGDPAAVVYVIETVRKLLGERPVFGICLGHQMMGLALGGETFKLKFGHRGANQPVKDLTTGKVEITAQNHGYCVNPDSLQSARVRMTHLNLNDNTLEGMEHLEVPAFSVQYHPEASPGPHDASYLFERFRKLMARSA